MQNNPKLIEIYHSGHFNTELISTESGMMIHEVFNDEVDFLILTYEDRVEVYLSLYDVEDSYRNHLSDGIAEDREEAVAIALANLHRQAY